jgi:hypothetical protein
MQPTNSVGIAKLAFCNWLNFLHAGPPPRPPFYRFPLRRLPARAIWRFRSLLSVLAIGGLFLKTEPIAKLASLLQNLG